MAEVKDSSRRALWLLLVVLVTAVFLWLVPRFSDWGVRSDCRSRYAAATTARDTAVVDALIPLHGRLEAVAPISCGMLRHAGKVTLDLSKHSSHAA